MSCIMVIVLFFLMIYSFFLPREKAFTTELDSLNGSIIYLYENLHWDPIHDIQLSNTTSCQNGFELLFLGTWDGLKPACVEDGTFVDDQPCIVNQLEGILPLTHYLWEEKRFCVKRLKLENSDYVLMEVCQDGFRECSPGICVKNSYSCPITRVTISESPQATRNLLIGNRYLNLYSEKGAQPLVNLIISRNGLPCFSEDKSLRGNRSYFLELNPAEGCDAVGVDPFSFPIDTKSQKEVLSQYEVYEKILKVPGYEEYLDRSILQLNGRLKIPVSPRNECKISLNVLTTVYSKEKGFLEFRKRFLTIVTVNLPWL